MIALKREVNDKKGLANLQECYFLEHFVTFECRDFLSNGGWKFLSEVFLKMSKTEIQTAIKTISYDES